MVKPGLTALVCGVAIGVILGVISRHGGGGIVPGTETAWGRVEEVIRKYKIPKRWLTRLKEAGEPLDVAWFEKTERRLLGNLYRQLHEMERLMKGVTGTPSRRQIKAFHVADPLRRFGRGHKMMDHSRKVVEAYSSPDGSRIPSIHYVSDLLQEFAQSETVLLGFAQLIRRAQNPAARAAYIEIAQARLDYLKNFTLFFRDKPRGMDEALGLIRGAYAGSRVDLVVEGTKGIVLEGRKTFDAVRFAGTFIRRVEKGIPHGSTEHRTVWIAISEEGLHLRTDAANIYSRILESGPVNEVTARAHVASGASGLGRVDDIATAHGFAFEIWEAEGYTQSRLLFSGRPPVH